jgi:VanZ family protein
MMGNPLRSVTAATLWPLYPWLAVVLLTVVTMGFFLGYDRYESVGPELLANPGFSEGFVHWERSGLGQATITSPGEITLRADENQRGAGVAVRQSLPEPQRYRLLRLSAELKAQAIQPGERFWHKGRLVLVSFDAQRRMLRVPHVVADLVGTRPWQSYQAIFHIPTTAQQVQIGVQLIGATGSLAVKQLSLREVRERALFPFYRYFGIALWTVALIGLAFSYRGQLRLDPPYLLIYASLLGILVGTLMPVELKLALENRIDVALTDVIPRLGFIPEDDRPSDPNLISKLGHLLSFGLLAFALRWAYPRQRLVTLLVLLLMLALISEVLQFFVEGRLPQITDFCIDGAGLLAGIGLFQLLRMTRLATCRDCVHDM